MSDINADEWRAQRIDWDEALRDVPTDDYMEDYDLDGWYARVQTVETFSFFLQNRRWFSWEAAIREEQGLPLSAAHEAGFDELLNFGDDDDILYIDDWARPREPWHQRLRPLAESLVLPALHSEVSQEEDSVSSGWKLLDALREHARGLELPVGADSLVELVGANTWHHLMVQGAFRNLEGLGQSWGDEVEVLEEQLDRVDTLLEDLRSRVDSVEAMGLTLDALLEIFILPEADGVTLVREVCARLGLPESSSALAPGLRRAQGS